MADAEAFTFGLLGALTGIALVLMAFLQRLRTGHEFRLQPAFVVSWLGTGILACLLGGVVALVFPSCASRGDAFVFGFAWEQVLGAAGYGVRLAGDRPRTGLGQMDDE